MLKFGARGPRSAIGELHQLGVVGLGLCQVAGPLGGPAGIEQSIEAIGTQGERLLVLGKRVLRTAELEQNIGEHFARRDVDLALTNLILQVRAACMCFSASVVLPSANAIQASISPRTMRAPVDSAK